VRLHEWDVLHRLSLAPTGCTFTTTHPFLPTLPSMPTIKNAPNNCFAESNVPILASHLWLCFLMSCEHAAASQHRGALLLWAAMWPKSSLSWFWRPNSTSYCGALRQEVRPSKEANELLFKSPPHSRYRVPSMDPAGVGYAAKLLHPLCIVEPLR
jgi:hypothetical protein